jgi:hypothetical protein
VRESGAHKIDLPHSFAGDRLGPLLVSDLFERTRENITGGVRHSLEWTDVGKQFRETCGIRNVCLKAPGLPPYGNDVVPVLLEYLADCRSNRASSNNDNFHACVPPPAAFPA